MTAPRAADRPRAAGLVMLAILLASTQDAIVKSVSGSYPVYETALMRGSVSLPILLFWFSRTNPWSDLLPQRWPRLLLRSVILCSAYFAFILAIAAIPISTAMAIYFTMPFFVAALSWPLLKERVPYYRWIAIVLGFAGVLIMVRPGYEKFEPAALLSLYAAFGYALGQMMGRDLSKSMAPLVIANWQNVTFIGIAALLGLIANYFGYQGEANRSLAFLTRPFVVPSLPDFILLEALGVMAACTIVCFVKAYSAAAAHFVAPFEYTGMVWAVLFGYSFFGDFPDGWTWAGMAIVVGAGLYMLLMDRRAQTG
jgi:drug/metabolite transporter (DMT)-like permease